MSRPSLPLAVRRGYPALAAMAVLAATATSARAQLYTTDPYDPSGRDFRQYVYPGGGQGFGSVVADRSRNYVAPNQFDRYTDDLDLPLGGKGSRYDSAFRRYDTDFQRSYIPNRKADASYYEARDKRESAMIEAMQEPDPTKRDQLVREATAKSRRATSDVSLSMRRVATVGSIPPSPRRRAAARTSAAVPPAPGRSATASPSRLEIPPAPRGTRGSPAATPSAAGRAALPTAPRSSDLPSDVLRRSRAMSQRRSIPTTPAAAPR